MGQLLLANCSHCEYEKYIYCGTGMLDHYKKIKYFGYPALDQINNELITANYFDEEIKFNNEVVFYNSKSLFLDYSMTENKICSFNNIVPDLFRANYYCPKCKKYKLSFMWHGRWD